MPRHFFPACLLLLLAPRAHAQDLPKLPLPLDVSVPLKSAPEAPAVLARRDDRAALPPARGGQPTATGALPADAVRDLIAAEVVVDTIDGEPWCAAESYKARFGPTGPEFFPYLGADAERHHPVAFALERVTVAGRPLPMRPSAARLVDRTVSYARGPATELYALRPEGIEQMFRFDTLPERGAIEVRVAVQTDLEPRAEGRGFVFDGPRGGVAYGAAVAIDASGARVEVETRLDDGALTLTVPAAFVGRAKLPLLIDPLIGTRWLGVPLNRLLRDTDLAYDASLAQYAVVFERVFSALDSDLYLQRLDASMLPIGPQVSIDISTVSWRRGRIAGLNAYDRFLCVAEVSAGNASPFWIGGRMYAPLEATPLFAPFDIAKAGLAGHAVGDKLRPDVGGDPSLATPTYFTVVFERVFTASDHDVCFKQVTHTGALRNASPTWIDNGSSMDSAPVISKSNGVMSAGEQRWAVAFHRRNPGGADSGHLRAATLTWDGQLRPLAVGVHDNLSGADPLGAGRFDVSSPTDPAAGKLFLLVETRRRPDGQTEVFGTAFDEQVVSRGSGVLTAARGVPCREPAVDTDGTRFAVAYVAEAAPSPNLDEDVWIQTVAPLPGQLRIDEELRLAGGVGIHNSPAVVAERSGRGLRSRYATSFATHLTTGDFRISAQVYEGAATGGLTTRPTGCGAAVQFSGSTALGESFTLTLPTGSAARGFLVGLPTTTPLPCASCVLGTTGFVSFALSTIEVGVPQNPSLVGAIVSFQGFDLGNGTCLGTVALSDTVDARLR